MLMRPTANSGLILVYARHRHLNLNRFEPTVKRGCGAYGVAMSEKKPEEPKPGGQYMGAGIALGMSLGIVFGLLMDNLAMGVAIGAGLGVVLGAIMSNRG